MLLRNLISKDILCYVLLCSGTLYSPTLITMIFDGYKKLNRVEKKESTSVSNVHSSVMRGNIEAIKGLDEYLKALSSIEYWP